MHPALLNYSRCRQISVPDTENGKLLREVWRAYRAQTSKLSNLSSADVVAKRTAAHQITDMAKKGRRVFIRPGFHEVIVHGGHYDSSSNPGVRVSFACDRNGGKYVLDARTLFAPSPLELLAMQADDDSTSEHEPADEI